MKSKLEGTCTSTFIHIGITWIYSSCFISWFSSFWFPIMIIDSRAYYYIKGMSSSFSSYSVYSGREKVKHVDGFNSFVMRTSKPSRVVHAKCIRGGRRRTLRSYGSSRVSSDSRLFFGLLLYFMHLGFWKVNVGDFIYFRSLDVFLLGILCFT